MRKEIKISIVSTTVNDLDTKDSGLVRDAREICKNAYAPYSDFKVGAAVLLDNGIVVTGSNQENIAYPSGLCAERVALFYAGSQYPESKVDTICIVATGDLVPDDTNLSPCGGCRQVMAETEMRQEGSYRVVLVNNNDTVTIFDSARDLLPLTFGSL